MIVYVYDNKTNKKKQTIKGVTQVVSAAGVFHIYQGEDMTDVHKENVKLVVYGF